MDQSFDSPSTRTRCPHCNKDSTQGTHGGCHECGRVKYTLSGRMPEHVRNAKRKRQKAA